MDFSDVSQILTVYIHDVVDHAFVVYEGDEEARTVLSQLSSDHRTASFHLFQLQKISQSGHLNKCNLISKQLYGNRLRLVAMHVRETPKSWASWVRIITLLPTQHAFVETISLKML